MAALLTDCMEQEIAMHNTTELGRNRTGMQVSRADMRDMMLEDTEMTALSDGDEMMLSRPCRSPA